jgi:hypothetical protein
MTTAFTDCPQIDELPEVSDAEAAEMLDDYYSQYEDDAALEYYSLCCAFGEEY